MTSDIVRELLEEIRRELGDDIQTVSVTRMALWLSPRCRLDPQGRESVYLIDEPVVEDALRKIALPRRPQEWYPDERGRNLDPIVKFLNNCVAQCNVAFDDIYDRRQGLSKFFTMVPREERYVPELLFIKWDHWLTVELASPVKLDICGINAQKNNGDVENDDDTELNLEVFVLVDDDWDRLVFKAGTHARMGFNSWKTRAFIPFIGVNYAAKSLRFLIFNRSGVIMNESLHLDDPTERFEVMKCMLGICLWRTQGDAGYSPLINNQRVLVPSRDGTLHPCRIVRTLYSNPSLSGKNTWVVQIVPEKPEEEAHSSSTENDENSPEDSEQGDESDSSDDDDESCSSMAGVQAAEVK